MQPYIEPHSEPPLKPLSDRELEVLGLKARGLNYKAIGSALGIRGRSAMQHARNARDKLFAINVTEAVAIASKRGLLANKPAEKPNAAIDEQSA